MELQTLSQIKARQAELVELEKEYAKKLSELSQLQVWVQSNREESLSLQRSISTLSVQANALKVQIAQDQLTATIASAKIDSMEVRANDVIRAKEQAIASIEAKADKMAKYCDTLEEKVAKVQEVEADIARVRGVQAKVFNELTEVSEMVLAQRKTYDTLVTAYTELNELIKQRKKDLSKFDELLIKLNA